MKRYVLLSYTGSDITADTIAALGSVLKANGVATGDVHGVSMSESEVCATIIKGVSQDPPKELSTVESACIYAEERFGKYFTNGLKLTLAIWEQAVKHPEDDVLINCIEILSRGVSTKMALQYRISKDVVSVFKEINKNLKNV